MATGSSAKAQHRREELSGVALLSMLLMEVIDESYRGTSQRFHKWTELETLKRLNIVLIKASAKFSVGDRVPALGLINGVELEMIWLDSTAVKA